MTGAPEARDAVVRARLLALRDEGTARTEALRGEVAGIVEASKDSNADDEHDPDGATIAFERAQVGALQRLAEQQVAEVDAALARLDASTYGTCEACGGPVGEARLEARPTARLCIACASAAGRSGRERR
ncbi:MULTISPECIES: TraR/DksA family transcriptional regulator [Oerskovia]|uniref:RNA polymerase-binding transcription factor DksA n=1 Tax=Oerskovia enterophila TaxID=43678 RepID=A0A163R2V3_9CELL|nr:MULTISPECIES: TraR/DksA C4-type zinc finger protein [Oerskovia]KZM34799.1 RNA polymerase-binding transcription factor DksA [Oerskovia enterophila]OCI32163.1 RNA polymerase-binding transcription factor DksA [Oerskovia enterophila]